jgi:dienelactone hydrolase
MLILFTLAILSSTEKPEMINYPAVWKVAQHEIPSGRILFAADPILLKLAEEPGFTPDWKEEAEVDEDGVVSHRYLRNGWAYSELQSDSDQTILVEGSGFHSLFVNGERFVGDYYSKGLLRVAVPMKEGANRLLVRAVRRGSFKLNFINAEELCSISPHDSLLPDMRENELLDSFGAVVILNHTGEILKDAVLEVGDSEVFQHTRHNVPPVIPYGLTKPPFPLKQLRQPDHDELDEKGLYQLPVTLNYKDTTQNIYLPIPVTKADEPYRVTKLSAIDGSVQYYAVRPPLNFDPNRDYYLYLTLHGAAVEAIGQARAYSSKVDGFIVAPTNRRPYGFDWQEWGRMDTLETMEMFISKHQIDPERIYLTGHSMGGHGTWYLGALYPYQFAAIGPSAGWISFSSYRDRFQNAKNEEELLPFQWGEMENHTIGLVENYTRLPIYAIHGEKDDNVPASESHLMISELEKFHKDFIYHEEPGAGHWWDYGGTPGAECVDWIPLFEFFRRHVRILNPLSITFRTPNPAISHSYAWLAIVSQTHPSKLCSINAEADPRIGKVEINTDNVERLRLALGEVLPQNKAQIHIDGSELAAPTDSPINLLNLGDKWEVSDPPDPRHKNSRRSGSFKMVFDKNMVWVYGTGGSDEENAAVLAKVRYDSQMWWYRGNGSVTIIPDYEFQQKAFAGRNIILYGNADINSLFKNLLSDCPIQINRTEVKIKEKDYSGDLGLLLVYPHPDSDENLIGVVGATTAKAMRMNFQARYFTSGVTCPDYVLFGAETLSEGMKGVIEAGYFTNEWDLE